MKKFIGFFILFAAAGYILLIGLQACGCLNEASEVKQPDFKTARNYLLFETTGRRIYVNDVTVTPSVEPGKEVYTPVGGYWEIKKGKYVYIDRPIPLDEAVFGEIELRRNSEDGQS